MSFTLGQGHFLQYRGIQEVVKITWPQYPDIRQPTDTLDLLLTCGSGRRLSLLYRAMRWDSDTRSPLSRAAWERDLNIVIEDGTWSAICELTYNIL